MTNPDLTPAQVALERLYARNEAQQAISQIESARETLLKALKRLEALDGPGQTDGEQTNLRMAIDDLDSNHFELSQTFAG